MLVSVLYANDNGINKRLYSELSSESIKYYSDKKLSMLPFKSFIQRLTIIQTIVKVYL